MYSHINSIKKNKLIQVLCDHFMDKREVKIDSWYFLQMVIAVVSLKPKQPPNLWLIIHLTSDGSCF
jgi:hypothetical protein